MADKKYDVTKYKRELILIELRRHFDLVDNNANILIQKAHSLLMNSAIVLSLFGALQAGNTNKSEFMGIGFAVLFVLFLLMIYFILMATRTEDYKTLFDLTWDSIKGTMEKHEDINKTLKQTATNYMDRIKHNEELNTKKSKFNDHASFIFGLMIFTIVILILLSLFCGG